MTLYELSRWTSTFVPSEFVTVVSKPLPVMSVVTAPAVPLPTLLTAAALALAAALPVTGFSASSCAGVPCAGPANFGGFCALDALGVVVLVVDDVVAPASAEPPRASAASAALPTSTFLMGWSIVCDPSVRPGLPGLTEHSACA